LALAAVPQARAEDPFITMIGPQSEKDPRVVFKKRVLDKIIEVTKAEYGPLTVKTDAPYVDRDRELAELVEGEVIQIAMEAVKPDWEAKALPIHIPADKNLTGCKVFLISKQAQEKWNKIETLEDFKKVPIGVSKGWATTPVMQDAGFNIVVGDSYDGLFSMLKAGRFDAIPRGISEFDGEYETRKADNPDLAIETHVWLCFPNPQYIFITPKRPDLVKRFQVGLEKIIKSGDMDAIVQDLFGPAIKKADFAKRKGFDIENKTITNPEDVKALGVKEYWYHP
jgi:ABC-type amino acid transport substrate-binding protein